MKKWIIILMILVAIASCDKSKQKPTVFGWPSSSAEADSLSDRFLTLIHSNCDIDTLKSINENFLKLSHDSLRHEFFNAMIFRRLNKIDSAVFILKNLECQIDSANNRYMWMRVKKALSPTCDDNLLKYSNLRECEDYFAQIKDTMSLYATYNELGVLFSQIRDFKTAEHYLKTAISLYEDPLLKVGPSLNLSANYSQSGDTATSIQILRGLLTQKHLYNSELIEAIYRNIYIKTHNLEDLQQGMTIVETDTILQSLVPLYKGMMGSYLLSIGDTIQAIECFDKVADRIYEIKRPIDRVCALEGLATLRYYQRRFDEAAQYLWDEQKLRDSMIIASRSSEISALETRERIMHMQEKARMDRKEERMKLIIVGISIFSILIIFTAILALKFHFHKIKAELRQKKSELEIEEGRRQIASTLLDIEEKDRFVKSISQHLKENIDKSRTTATFTLHELEKMVSMYEIGTENRENFIEMFKRISPDFFVNLRTRYPMLKESQVKLAAYIFAGMNNSQIARMLMVKVETVFQSRWLLRKNMGLERSQTLEEALCSLARHSSENKLKQPVLIGEFKMDK